jgi:hypothetical protein
MGAIMPPLPPGEAMKTIVVAAWLCTTTLAGNPGRLAPG